jgi:hypothetical protein
VLFNYLRKIFGNKPKQSALVSLLDDSTAVTSYGGQNIYASDYVNNCIDRVAREIGKMSIMSVVFGDDTVKRQNDELTRLFRAKPNPLQTTSDFLRACAWLRLKDCNCFIYPEFDWITDSRGNTTKYFKALWPLNPTEIEIGTDDSGDLWEIKFRWRSGGYDIIPYRDLVHLKWRRGKNLIIGGGSDFGWPDTRDLQKSVGALGSMLDTVPKSLQASLKITGIYHAKTIVDMNTLKDMRDSFEDHIKTSQMGIVATDLPGDFTPVNMQQMRIDDSIFKFLKGVIQERYGISTAVLSGDYTPEQYDAFFQTCIEDFQVEFEQAMSACLFTQRELDLGHWLKTYCNRAAFLTNEQKIKFIDIGTRIEMVSVNEAREMFGMEPVPDGDRRFRSLNYVDSQLANSYQASMSKSGDLGKSKKGETDGKEE